MLSGARVRSEKRLVASTPSPLPPGVRSIVMSMYVRLSARISRKNHTAELRQMFLHVVGGCGSVLLWPRCDMLRTSGFVMTSCFHVTYETACHACNLTTFHLDLWSLTHYRILIASHTLQVKRNHQRVAPEVPKIVFWYFLTSAVDSSR